MPFTFAHPAAVLPLRRLRSLHTIPLIIGSIAPDLPYYIPSRFNRLMLDTHTAAGALWLDVPIGLCVLLFSFILRGPLTILMTPRARALTLQSMERFQAQPRHWLLAALAIYVGAWTHLAWDSFTHDNGWIVRRVAALSAPISIGDYYTGTMCHVLQYVSSIAGLLILAIWYFRLPTPATEPPGIIAPSRAGRVLILVLAVTAASAIGVYIAGRAALLGNSNYRVIYLLLTRAIAWFATLYLAAGLCITLNRRKPEPVAET
jgi:Domain of unknown function (DUF4184)